jgi:hypothetical protein
LRRVGCGTGYNTVKIIVFPDEAAKTISSESRMGEKKKVLTELSTI